MSERKLNEMKRYDTIRYDTIRYDTIRYDTIRYDTIRYDTIRSPTSMSTSTTQSNPTPFARASLKMRLAPLGAPLGAPLRSTHPSWTIPASLDTLGGLVGMKHFKANQNLIRKLPDSICRMTKMEVIEAKNNYLDGLPEQLGNLTKMTKMILNQNEIATLPDSMISCTSLVEVSERSELAFWKTSILAMKCAKWLPSDGYIYIHTKLTNQPQPNSFGSLILFRSSFIKNAHYLASLGAAPNDR